MPGGILGKQAVDQAYQQASRDVDYECGCGEAAPVPWNDCRDKISEYAADTASDGSSAVLYDILDTPVSPELLPAKDGVISQRTEDIVGPYELHDFFLYYLVRFGFAPGKIFRLASVAFKDVYGRDVIKKWLVIFIRRFFAQQFKRSCLPDGPKVGTVTLSPRSDWRMPSDASASAWIEEAEALQI